jgi:hypothetical protein
MNLKELKIQEKERLESILHPTLTVSLNTVTNENVGMAQILHEHRGKAIVFSAWKDGNQINNRFYSISRNIVLMSRTRDDFYGIFSDDLFHYLIEGTDSRSIK